MDALNAAASRFYPENMKLSEMPYLVPHPLEELKLVKTADYGTRLVATIRDPTDVDRQFNVWLPKRVSNTPQATLDEINGEATMFLVHSGTKRARNPKFDSELFVFVKNPADPISVGPGVFQEKRIK